MSYLVTRTSILWDGDKHGYPWREVYAETLYHGQQVVVLSPKCDDPCHEDLRRWAKVEPGLKVIDSPSLAEDITTHGPAIMDAIENHCDGEFIVHLGSDELLEMEPFMGWLEQQPNAIHADATLIKFWRWDFTYSSRLITELWTPHERMLIAQGVAKKWCHDSVGITSGAGGFIGVNNFVECPCPIWHYNGLTSELQHAVKHRNLFMSDQKIVELAGRIPGRRKGNEVPIERCGWNYYIGENRASSRARPVPRSHPKIMWPWLSQAEMHWRQSEER